MIERSTWFRAVTAKSRLSTAALALALALLASAPGTAAPVPAQQAAASGDQAAPAAQNPMYDPAVRHFTLSESFLKKVAAVAEEAQSMKNKPHIDPSGTHSLDELAAKLESNPDVHTLLSRHGLTARQYLAGTFALASAAMAAQMKQNPAMAKYLDPAKVNQANVAFYEQHETEINDLLHIKQRQPAASGSAGQ